MPFQLDSKEPRRFFYGADKKEWIDLILLDEDDFQAIRERLKIRTEWQFIPNPAKDDKPLEPVPVMLSEDQQVEFARAVNFESIPAWRLFDDSGKEIPHTSENVSLMMRRCRAFKAFVEKSRKTLRADQEAEIKN